MASEVRAEATATMPDFNMTRFMHRSRIRGHHARSLLQTRFLQCTIIVNNCLNSGVISAYPMPESLFRAIRAS
jgi:hypothetical protein